MGLGVIGSIGCLLLARMLQESTAIAGITTDIAVGFGIIAIFLGLSVLLALHGVVAPERWVAVDGADLVIGQGRFRLRIRRYPLRDVSSLELRRQLSYDNDVSVEISLRSRSGDLIFRHSVSPEKAADLRAGFESFAASIDISST